MLPGEISKGVGDAGQGRLKAKPGVISGGVLALPCDGTGNIHYTLELSPKVK